MISEELRKQAMAETREHGQASCVTTRDGRAVRVYADDHRSAYPVRGAMAVDGDWISACWHINGQWGIGPDGWADALIPARRSGEETLYVYDTGRESYAAGQPVTVSGWRLIARVPVKWTEGDGI